MTLQEENYIQTLFAQRIGGSDFGKKDELYKFEKIKRAKKLAKELNPTKQLIDLGVGEPDQMAPMEVIQELEKEAKKLENRFYADNGIDEFKQAAATYMKEVFGVENLDATNEINHVIGVKSGLSILPAAFINPGDLTLMPTPSYSILGTHTTYLGGEVYTIPLTKENSFLPDLEAIPPPIAKKAKLLYLNYPNNPTGATATKEFFQSVVEFAKKYQIIVVHDAAYASLVFDEKDQLSFLSIPGAKDVGVELHSLSKSFNMTGWRIGFIAGNEKVIAALRNVKDQYDSGQFIPIQKAAAYALAHPPFTEAIAKTYSRRHDLLVEVLLSCGFHVEKPKGSFFLYAPIPKGVLNGPTFITAEDFSQFLIKELLLSTVPWDDAGAYIRFSVTFEAKNEKEEKEILNLVKQRLQSVSFIF